VTDVHAGLPAVTGRLELEYEGELQGGLAVARELIRRAAGALVADRGVHPAVEEVVGWFDAGGALKVGNDDPTEAAYRAFRTVPGLVPLVQDLGFAEASDEGVVVSACELVLEALVDQQRISRSEESGWQRARPARRRSPGHGGMEPGLG
jgi:magnesium chelatase subunit I